MIQRQLPKWCPAVAKLQTRDFVTNLVVSSRACLSFDVREPGGLLPFSLLISLQFHQPQAPLYRVSHSPTALLPLTVFTLKPNTYLISCSTPQSLCATIPTHCRVLLSLSSELPGPSLLLCFRTSHCLGLSLCLLLSCLVGTVSG